LRVSGGGSLPSFPFEGSDTIVSRPRRTSILLRWDALSSRRAGNALKIVIAGGSGQVGQLLARTFKRHDHQVVVLGRQASAGVMAWDGQSLGDWAQELDGADVVINLAGRSVNCRYTAANMKDMMESRVNSTRVVGQAIELATVPPRVWLQMSTATIYAHRFDAANDEVTGIIGGNEPEVPAYWGYSIQIAQAWEKALDEANTPRTRKVALRTAMVMSADRGGIFDVLLKLVRTGLGGSMAGGKQYMSWIHGDDFVTRRGGEVVIRFIIGQESGTRGYRDRQCTALMFPMLRKRTQPFLGPSDSWPPPARFTSQNAPFSGVSPSLAWSRRAGGRKVATHVAWRRSEVSPERFV